jgi:hypothetical protein
LSVIASGIGNTRVIRLKRTWHEQPILWTAVVSDSGTLKSPASDLSKKYLFKVQRRLLEEHKRESAEYQNQLTEWRAKKKEFDKHKQGKGDEKGAIPEDPGKEPEAPILKRVIVNDTTIEKLAEILEDNPRGTLVARDELAGWIASFTKYKSKGAGSDVANWLELNRAGTLIIDRKTGERRTQYIEPASACVTGGIQPGVLARALTPDLLDSGLAARLLLCWPPRLPKKWTENEIDPDIEGAFHTLIDKLIELDFVEDKDGEKIPLALRMDDQAKALWVEWYDQWAKEQTAVEGELAAAYSKLEGYAARFALIYHVYAISGCDDKAPICAESMKAGITLARWFANEARRIYASISETTEERDLRRLIDFISARGGEITARDLWKSNNKRYAGAPDAEATLNSLVESGLGEWIDRPAGPKGGRPTRVFKLRTPKPQNPETPSDGEDGDGENAPHNPNDNGDTPKNHG